MFFAVELGAVLSAIILAFLFRKEKQAVPKNNAHTHVTNYVPTILLGGAIVLLIAASFLPNKPSITNGLICCTLLDVYKRQPTYRTLKLPDQTLQIIAQHQIEQNNPNFSDHQIYIVISGLSTLQKDLDTLQELNALKQSENAETEMENSTNWANVTWSYCCLLYTSRCV